MSEAPLITPKRKSYIEEAVLISLIILSLLGLFLGFSAVIPTYTEQFFWIELVIAVVIVVLTLIWEIWSTRKLQP